MDRILILRCVRVLCTRYTLKIGQIPSPAEQYQSARPLTIVAGVVLHALHEPTHPPNAGAAESDPAVVTSNLPDAPAFLKSSTTRWRICSGEPLRSSMGGICPLISASGIFSGLKRHRLLVRS